MDIGFFKSIFSIGVVYFRIAVIELGNSTFFEKRLLFFHGLLCDVEVQFFTFKTNSVDVFGIFELYYNLSIFDQIAQSKRAAGFRIDQ